MKHKLIKTDNYLLVVDESEIKKGDWCLDLGTNKIFKAGLSVGDEYKELFKKIIFHLPLNNSPVLEGVPLLPPLEDEVEKLADEASQKFKRNNELDDLILGVSANSFEEGYNKAKEKYKYTEEDMRKAIDMARKIDEYLEWEWHSEKIIQSLQQPKYPVAFECEKVTIWARNADRNVPTLDAFDYVPKTITNSQGQTQLVGTYIYE